VSTPAAAAANPADYGRRYGERDRRLDEISRLLGAPIAAVAGRAGPTAGWVFTSPSGRTVFG
jgi:hypothetical protein